MRNHTSLKTRLLCLFLILSMLTLTACDSQNIDSGNSTESSGVSDPSKASPDDHVDPRKEQERFSAFTYDVFLESVLANTINLHYTIADPESYGITEYPITLGSYEVWTEEDILADLDEMAVELATYHYNVLTEEQQMTYDLLQHYIETERDAADLYLYGEPLGPTTGAATQLPITMAEYKFYCEQDIKDYLQLLPLMQGYFESIIAFEEARIAAGLFMSEATLDANLEICADFVENPEKNFLITSFASRLEKVDWLDDQAKADYIEQNRTIVMDSVFPAYDYLASALEDLRQHCTIDGGLAELPEGQEYFAYLMASRIGPDRTVEEMLQLIEEYQQSQIMQMSILMYRNPELETAANTFGFTMTEPAEILDYLKEKIAADYPEIPDTSYTIKYVEKELEEVLSPAFYMIPPLDRYLENTIYINNGSVDSGSLFSTLAHEGYPGHLYQNVYFNSNNTEPLRSMLSYLGYSEGWATYVENEAYAYDPSIDSDLLNMMALNNSITLSIYAALDIYINYEGWDREATNDYLSQYFELDKATSDLIYDTIAGDPCYYLAYHGGYLEIMEMRAVAEATLGDDFNLKEFHQFVLDLGECPFSIANQRLADWLETKE